MPTALATTKRKFHKLLDSISNASSTSLAANHERNNLSTTTLPANLTPPAKKPRFERPISAYVPPSQRLASNPRPATYLPTVVRPASSGSKKEEPKTPNFTPWDRGRFLERLKTYRHVDKWLGKPDKISEVEWAKRGWSCVGKETVRCVGGCDLEVVIKLEEDTPPQQAEGEENIIRAEEEENEWREEAQKQLVEKYAEMISSAHDVGCLWRRRGCDDTIHRLPLAHKTVALEGLRHRYQLLTVMASDLPATLSTPDILERSKLVDFATSVLQHGMSSDATARNPRKEPSDTSIEASQPLEDINVSAFTLALFGWQAEEGHISGLATCTACFRRLGLWLFKPSGDDPDSQSSMDRLDVVDEHRDYCPWINVLSQNGGSRRSSLDVLSGWEVVWRHVNNTAMYRRDGTAGIRAESEKENVEAAGQVGSAVSSDSTAEEKAAIEQKDQERWAKLKRLKQVFQAKKKSTNLRAARDGR